MFRVTDNYLFDGAKVHKKSNICKFYLQKTAYRQRRVGFGIVFVTITYGNRKQ